jgi:hypothetical protein
VFDLQLFSSSPRKVAQAFDFIAAWNGTVDTGSSTQIAFTPINYKAATVPPNAPGRAVAVIPAFEIIISNPSTESLQVAVGDVVSAGLGALALYPSMDGGQVSRMKPVFLDPESLPAITSGNMIVVPPGAIAFPIRVRAYGLTITAVSANAANVSIQAYGPISLYT